MAHRASNIHANLGNKKEVSHFAREVWRPNYLTWKKDRAKHKAYFNLFESININRFCWDSGIFHAALPKIGPERRRYSNASYGYWKRKEREKEELECNVTKPNSVSPIVFCS